ncbi:protein fam49b isoform 1 [Lichtheimia corymbifera JMRC:FSU:9682]|uniref:Protein fam49b isoform 1 n=1 Tax=Lichtheimia corymbifera JMRC:FSU:9682 TaxID=1263082 RepID=A0A068RYQ2_9FUNG|nr:protein fam49b isoform 1 [Lichtheimia corymbifera JMRC:FSU:9682]
MGQLLSSLNLRGGDTVVPDLGFDIENARPSAEESELYNQLSILLVQPAPDLLGSLRSYRSASELIREAIASPTTENENRAWDAVLPTVDMLRDFYEYASELEENIPRLLDVLCQGDVNKNLEKHQGLTRLFADILDFVFEFDFLKMRNPTLQNDFSYYRRMLQRGRYSRSADESMSDLRSAMLEDDQANRMSLFIAYPTPMLRRLIDTTTEYVTRNRLQKSVGSCLTALWSTCYHTVNKKRSPQPSANVSSFCLKVMVVSIILYDHIDSHGAFTKSSPINIKHSVKIIQSVPDASTESSTSNLMSALRYNSKHLNDDSTPKSIRNSVMAA